MLPRAIETGPGLDAGSIYDVKIWLLQIFSAALPYGFFLCLGIVTIYTVMQQPLQGNRARQALLALILIMLIGATAHLVLHVVLLMVQLPSLGDEYDDRHNLIQAILLAQTYIRRLTYFLSDIIVVWRAWVIWPNSRLVHAVLLFCLVGTFGTSLTLAVWNYKSRFQHRHYESLDQNFLGTFPLLITNFASTALISYKLWHYRQNIKVYLNRVGSSRKSKVESVLILLMESGWLYLAFWVLLMVGDFGYFGDFGFEWFQPNISGIYPTAIIFMVSRQMTMGEDLIDTELMFNSELYHTSDSNPRTVDRHWRQDLAAGTGATTTTIWFASRRRSGGSVASEADHGGGDSIALNRNRNRESGATSTVKEIEEPDP